jgi:endonuclease/exonuclease/phosphatase family metal-dependent hydrolase
MLGTVLKVFTLFLVGLVALVGCQTMRNSGNADLAPNDTQTLRVATYNVHYIILGQQTGPWSVGDWDRRKGPMDLAFKDIDADVIGFQEMESFARGSGNDTNLTLDWLLANNPGYAAAAVGDPSTFPSTQPILYRTDKLTMLDQGWFFFSETPDVIYSRTFNGSYPAFASWAQFEDQTSGAVFRVVNVHTDYASLSNRQKSIALVAERIAPWIAGREALFVIGDLNARLGDRLVRTLEDTGLSFVPVRGSTYHFNRGINLFGAVDHIATTDHAQLIGAPVVLRKKYAGEWPTDHYPLVADFQLVDP